MCWSGQYWPVSYKTSPDRGDLQRRSGALASWIGSFVSLVQGLQSMRVQGLEQRNVRGSWCADVGVCCISEPQELFGLLFCS